jgi:hypothetical protein
MRMADEKYGWHSEFGVVGTNSIWMADEKYVKNCSIKVRGCVVFRRYFSHNMVFFLNFLKIVVFFL